MTVSFEPVSASLGLEVANLGRLSGAEAQPGARWYRYRKEERRAIDPSLVFSGRAVIGADFVARS